MRGEKKSHNLSRLFNFSVKKKKKKSPLTLFVTNLFRQHFHLSIVAGS